MRTQYRVRWKREGLSPKYRGCASIATAEKLIGLLTSAEPWKFIREFERKDPDDYYCCDGHECGCDGRTVREWCASKRDGLPPIEWVRIESRQVTPFVSFMDCSTGSPARRQASIGANGESDAR